MGWRTKAARGLGLALAAAVSAHASSAAAQVVAVVKTADDIPPFEAAIASFQAELGGEVVVESLAADPARWPKVREKLEKRRPVAWVPVGPLALQAVATAASAEPVVFMMVPHSGQVLGGRDAGVAGISMKLAAEPQLAELRAILPGARRVGVLHDPKNTREDVAEAAVAARKLGLELVVGEVADPASLGGALRTLLERDIDVLWMVPDRTVTPPGTKEAFEHVAATTLRAGVPVVGYAPKLTESGALFSVGPDYADVGVQAARLLREVLAGTPASSLGVRPARKTELTVNLRVAATLGVPIPKEAAARAAATFR